VFALGGTAKLPPPPPRRDPIPTPNVKIAATTTELADGSALFTAYCSRCHSFTSNLVKGGAVPDLRRTTPAVHATFDSIVIGGARRALGMPSFAKDLDAAQVRLIPAYVVDEAQRASNPSRVRP